MINGMSLRECLMVIECNAFKRFEMRQLLRLKLLWKNILLGNIILNKEIVLKVNLLPQDTINRYPDLHCLASCTQAIDRPWNLRLINPNPIIRSNCNLEY